MSWSPPPRTSPWASVDIPVLAPTGWSVSSVHAGLQDLERIRRQVDAATALLIGALPKDRDSTAALVRSLGVSTREARRRRDVAAVVGAVPAAPELLAAGAVSAEHVAALVPVISDPTAATELLGAAAADGHSPEEVGRAVRQHLLDHEHGSDSGRRQRALRSLRFFTGPEGMVGLNGLLPSLEGATLKAMVDEIVNRRWQVEHPERARVLGGHGGDSREQRAADALCELVGIRRFETQGDAPTPTPAAAVSDIDAAVRFPAPKASPPTTRQPPKPTVVIVFDIDRYQAEMIGVGPVAVTPSLFDQAKTDLYYSFVSMNGEILKFGRARRDPTPLQRIAVIARDRTCFYPGCTVPATQCEIHHINEWLIDHGFTDIDALVASCKAHHGHVHLEALIAQRERDGTVTVRERSTGIIVAVAGPARRPAAAA